MKKDKLYSDKTVIEKFITEITKNWLKNVSDKGCFEIRCIKEKVSQKEHKSFFIFEMVHIFPKTEFSNFDFP